MNNIEHTNIGAYIQPITLKAAGNSQSLRNNK